MFGASLIHRNLQVGWAPLLSVCDFEDRRCIFADQSQGRKKFATLIKASAHWWVVGLLPADTKLFQYLLHAASPKANGRGDYICGTHQGSRSRLLMCKSTS